MSFRRGFALLLLLALFAVANVAPAAATPAARAPDWTAPQVPDQLIVPMPPGGRAALARAGATVVREIPQLGLALVAAQRGRTLPEAAVDLERAGVAWSEPNYIFSLDYAPNDPDYAPRQAAYLTRIDASAAWDLTQGRPEIIIAVLDTGVDMAHEDLRDAIWTNPGEIPNNGVDDEGNGFADDVHGWDFAANDNLPDDDHYHGTHVAGIAAARIDNGVGIAGLAGRATIMPVDVFGGGIGTYEDLIRAIIYATDNGADVINMSLGASSYSIGEEAAVNYAHSRGVVVVAAAGNTMREELHYPAAHDNAIAVASTDANDNLSIFSTRGEFVDVAAPGSSIYSTFPGNSYGSLSGTSMATPHVSALAALVLSRNPALTPNEVRAVIEGTVDDLAPAGRDIYFGEGRINAGRALAAVAPAQPQPTPAPGPAHDLDLAGCVELVTSGGFEVGLVGWQAQGAVAADNQISAAGSASVHFAGGVSVSGQLSQTIAFPANAIAAVVKFNYRIKPFDSGRGTSPDWPFDDWFVAEWRSAARQPLGQLLRTGNTADTVNGGLEWDEYLYRMDAGDLARLLEQGPVSLVFAAQNDGDEYPTDVWVDSVRVCVKTATDRAYLPLLSANH